MGKFQAMHKYVAVFLVLFACHDSLLTHGRKIKALNTETPLEPLETDVNVPNLSPSPEKIVDSTMMPKHSVASFGDTKAFRPTTPGSSPGVGHKFFSGEQGMKVDSTMMPKHSVASFGDTNAFRPTTPGSSPGVGHKFFAGEQGMKVDSTMMPKHSVASFGDTNAFRPTTPGSSPGVGHKFFAGEQGMKAMVVVQSPDVKVYVTEGSKNDISPTTAGHTPGVGHSGQYKNGKLN